MAYMSQENKKQLAPGIKAVLKKYGMKGTIRVEHHSVLHVNIKSGELDVVGNYRNTLANRGHSWDRDTWWIRDQSKYMQISHHHLSNSFSGKVLAFLQELFTEMMKGNHDNSDAMTDYFDVGWYAYVNLGKWSQPYELTGDPEAKTKALLSLEAQHREKEAA